MFKKLAILICCGIMATGLLAPHRAEASSIFGGKQTPYEIARREIASSRPTTPAAKARKRLRLNLLDMANQLCQKGQESGITRVAVVAPNGPGECRSRFSNYLADELKGLIGRLNAFQAVVERSQLEEIIRRRNLELSGRFDKSTVASLGKLAGLNGLVLGKLTDLGDSLTLSCDLIWVKNGEVAASSSTDVEKSPVVDALIGDKLSADLTVFVDPAGVPGKLFLDQKVTLLPAERVVFKDLCQGLHKLVVRAACFETMNRDLDLNGDQTLTIKMKPVKQKLYFRVKPPNAEVVINGEPWDIDNAGAGEAELGPGLHRMVVTADGMPAKTREIRMACAPKTVRVDLEKPDHWLRLMVNPPRAVVSLDGQKLITDGTGRWEGRLNEGVHTISALAPKYDPMNLSVDLNQDTDKTINLKPALYMLTVRVRPPSAKVLLDGKELAKVSKGVASGRAAVGDHVLLVTEPGFQDESRQIKVDGASQQEVELKPKPVNLVLELKTPGAEVMLDGKPLKIGQDGRWKGSLKPGEYTVTAKAPHHKPGSWRLDLRKDHLQALELSAADYPLTVKFTPGGAMVKLDGDELPLEGPGLAKAPVPFGDHKLVVSAQGHEPESRKIRITGPAEHSFQLKPLPREVSLKVSTPGAKLLIDGKAVTLDQNGHWKGRLASGPHKVVVSAPHFEDRTLDMNLTGDLNKTIDLAAQKYMVKLKVKPASAVVEVDGERLSPGQGGLFQANLESGKHRLKVTAPGHAPLEEPLDVAGDMEKKIALTQAPLDLEVQAIREGALGVPTQMREGDKLRTGAGYALAFKASSDCHVYVFQVDSGGQAWTLFPNPEWSKGENPVRGGRWYWIPSQDEWIEMAGDPGREKFIILASRKKPDKIDALHQKLLKVPPADSLGRDQLTRSIEGEIKMRSPGRVRPAKYGNLSHAGKKIETGRILEVTGADAVYRLGVIHR